MYYQQPKFSNTVLTNQSLLELSDDLTLTNVSSIPEDVLEAETYYSQFENEFEDDEDLEDLDDSGGSEGTDEDNDEHSALINQLQAAPRT